MTATCAEALQLRTAREDDRAIPSAGSIWLVAYNGFSERYFLHCGLVEKLLETPEAHVVILVRPAEVERVSREFPDSRIAVRPFAYDEIRRFHARSPLRARLAQIRLMVLDARAEHGTANIWSRKFFERYRSLGPLHRLSQFYLRVATYLLRRSRLLRRCMRAVDGRMDRTSFHAGLFEEFPPSVVVVPSLGYFMQDAYIIREVRRHGRRSLGVMTNWDHPVSKGVSAALPDRALVWGPRNRTEARTHHDMPDAAIEEVGPALYDHYFRVEKAGDRAFFLRSCGLDPARKTILFAAMSPRPFPWNVDLVEMLARACADGRYGVPVQLLFRLHPNHAALRQENAERWKAEMNRLAAIRERWSHVAVQEPAWSGSADSFSLERKDADELASAIRHSDVVVTVFSTLNLEAAILDCPTINCAIFGHDAQLGKQNRVFGEITHLRGIYEHANSRIVETEAALHDVVKAYLDDPSLDRQGRRSFLAHEIGHLGGATDRLARAILRERQQYYDARAKKPLEVDDVAAVGS